MQTLLCYYKQKTLFNLNHLRTSDKLRTANDKTIVHYFKLLFFNLR